MSERSTLWSAVVLAASLATFAMMPANANAAAQSSVDSADQFSPEASPIEAAALPGEGCKLTCKIGSFCLPIC